MDPDPGVGGDHGQRGHVLAEEGDLSVSQVGPVDAVALSALEQRIVDIGDVLGVPNVDAAVAQRPADQVEGHIGRGVPQVRRVIRRNAADIHAGRRALSDELETTRAGVMELERLPLPGHGGQAGHRPRDHGTEA